MIVKLNATSKVRIIISPAVRDIDKLAKDAKYAEGCGSLLIFPCVLCVYESYLRYIFLKLLW